MNLTSIDVTERTDEAANAALCAFNEAVFTSAGRIEPKGEGFVLLVEDKKPRDFSTASGAIEVLRRMTRQNIAQ